MLYINVLMTLKRNTYHTILFECRLICSTITLSIPMQFQLPNHDILTHYLVSKYKNDKNVYNTIKIKHKIPLPNKLHRGEIRQIRIDYT